MTTGQISVEREGHVLLIDLDRAAKPNAVDLPQFDLRPSMKSDGVQKGLRAFTERRPGACHGR